MATDVGTLQGKLELDMSGFNTAMNQATNLVRQFGQQLQGALGSAATQSFSATNQAVQNLAAEMQSLTANAQNLISSLGQVNSQMAGFLNTIQTSSSLGNNMNGAAQGAQNTADATRQASDNSREAARGANQLNSNLSGASSNASRTAQNTRGAAAGANRAANNANKLNKNLQQSAAFADNVKHILSGIIISQSFYRLLGVMQDLVSNANQFMLYMEQSEVSFKYLLGSAENASGFLQSLQDFAVSSPLDMQGATQSARLLMTMGVEAQNVVGVLRVLTDAATVAGGDMEDTIYRISLALGQMLQSGTVKAQEIRQLVNANIPVLEILREELGLTADQVANIGKEGVNSATAVNAILHGLQKRFSGASLDMQKTLTGAMSAAKDSFYVLYNVAMQGPFNALREKVVSLADALQYLAQIARNTGIGGVFEKLVPPSLQPIIRNVIGAIGQLGYALKYVALVASDIFGASFVELAHIFSLILPPISIFLNAIMQLAHYILQICPVLRYAIGMFVAFSILSKIGTIVMWFWRVMGLGKICMMIASWVGTLMKALAGLAAVMVAHPAVLIFTLIVGAALAATGAIQKLINKLKELFSMIGLKWANMNKTLNQNLNIGYDPKKIMSPIKKKEQDNATKYNNTLQNIADSLGDVGKGADKAGKKLKQNFNQSFDEVYTINPTKDAASDLGAGGLGDIDLSDAIGQLDDFNSALGELGDFDFSGWDQNFMDEWDKMWESIKSYISDYGVGALLAGVLTALLTGNPWIGLAAGLAALFWPAIADALGLTEAQGQTILGAAIGALLGAVIAKICGAGLLQGAVWSGIGALIFAGLWPAIQEYMDSGDWKKSLEALNFTLFGAGIGALIGNLIGGPIGAGIGALIGGFLGNGIEGGIDAWINGGTWQDIVQGFSWDSIGAGIGALIGTCIAPGIGTALGAAIGLMLGNLVELIIDGLVTGDWDVEGIAKAIGTIILAAIGLITGGPVGLLIGVGISSLVSWIYDKMKEDFETTGDAFSVPISTTIGTSLGAAIGLVAGGPAGAGIGAAIGSLVGWIFGKLTDGIESNAGGFDKIGTELGLGIGGAIGFIAGGPAGAAIGAALGSLVGWMVGEWAYIFSNYDISEIGEALKQWLIDSVTSVFSYDWTRDLFELAGFFFEDAIDAFKEQDWGRLGEDILKGILAGITGILSAIFEPIARVFKGIWDAFCDLFGIHSPAKEMEPIGKNILFGLLEGLVGAISSIAGYIAGVGAEIISTIGGWFTSIGSKVVGWLSDAKEAIGGWITDTASAIGGWVSDRVADFTSWATNTKDKVTGWVSDTASSIGGWITGTASSIGGWISDTASGIGGWVTDTASSIGSWVTDTASNIGGWATDTASNIGSWVTDTATSIGGWITNTASAIGGWVTDTASNIGGWVTDRATDFANFASDGVSKVANWAADTASSIGSWITDTGSSIGSWVSNRVSDFGNWATNTKEKIGNWVTNTKEKIGNWSTDTKEKFSNWASDTKNKVVTWATDVKNKVVNWASETKGKFTTWVSDTKSNIQNWASVTKGNVVSWVSDTKDKLFTWASNTKEKIGDWWSDVKGKFQNFKNLSFTDWCSNTFNTISNWCSNVWSSIKDKIGNAINKVKEFLGLSSSGANVSVNVSGGAAGHATGGVFNREHWARFAEGNKAEAIIPLENKTAMQPFVDAVSNGLTASLAPIISSVNKGGGNDLQPLYVGTLIADERGLKELERKMQIIRVKENRRG